MGRYQLIRKLATGGMAEVFLAKASGPLGFEKHLVVKRILPHLAEDPQFVEMFLTEAKVAARLNHANIVQIFDFGMEGDSYFIAMEYVDGVDLRTLKRRAFQQGTPIPLPLCARLMTLACDGLAYAHELTDPETGQPLRLIHRDISPDNIFASKTGGLKVLDFGIAKATNAGHRTQSGILKGKLPYMAPEYLLGEGIDARADIYALGVVLFELVAGHRPYRSDNDVRLIQAVINEPLPDVRDFRQDVPDPLAAILSRALAKDREQRYRSCRELHSDLEHFLYLYREPVGAPQIARYIQAMSGPPPSQRPGESLPTTPEPRPRVDTSGMEAPRSAVTQQEAEPGPPPHLAETQPLPQAPPAEPPAPPRAAPAPSTSRFATEEAPAPPRRQRSRPEAPRARPAADGGASTPGTGALRRNLRWGVPALLLAVAAGTTTAVFRSEPSGEQPGAATLPPVPSPPVETADTGQAPPPGVASAPTSPEAPPEPPAAPAAQAPDGLRAEAPPAAAPVAEPAPATEGLAHVRVTSNLTGEVRINGLKVGRTPLDYTAPPGKLRISIDGVHQGERFGKEQVLEVAADERRDVEFKIQRVTVTLRGRPDDMRVLQLDGRELAGQVKVTTYEGQHRLLLHHPPTNTQHTTSCTATQGDKLCRFSVKNAP